MDERSREALGGDLAPTEAEGGAALRHPRLAALLLGAAILAAFTALGALSARIQSIVPGTVAGFFLLTLALALVERRRAARAPRSIRAVEHGLVPIARVLLAHMGLLFVPAGVAGVYGLLALPRAALLAAASAVLVSTLTGFATVALIMRRRT